jgi:hypothetical protein
MDLKEEGMMNGSIPLSTARQQLAEAVSRAQPTTFAPLDISPWLAMALLQKAIRRGRGEIAQQAAATLLQISPERLWRRCGGIAFEDIGVADLETVSLVTAALAGKTVRASLGGEWPVASFIVSRMVHAPKCRATDDLLMTAELHPAYEQSRQELALRSTPDLLTIATGSTALQERALALWYAIGTNRRPSRHLRLRRGEPATAFDALREAGFPQNVVETSREGFRRVGEVLCPFLVLLSAINQPGPEAIVDDDLPPEAMIGPIPGWAIDLYSREGRAALTRFLRADCATARWVSEHVSPARRVDFLGGVIFRAEGGLLAKRLRWPTGDDLRRRVDLECHGVEARNVAQLLTLLRADIPVLNRVRAEVMGSARHAV